MSSIDTPLFTDPAHLAKLKVQARNDTAGDDIGNLREVARQFESLFTHMLMKNMRAASLGDGAFDSDQSKFYQDMFDQQMSTELTNGNGLGIADLLVKQLGGGKSSHSNPAEPGRMELPGRVQSQQPLTLAGIAAAQLSTNHAAHFRMGSPSFSNSRNPMVEGSLHPSEAPSTTAHIKTPERNSFMAEPRVSVMKANDGGISDPVDFVRKALPHARRVGKLLGVAPQLILAQAALESGWGRKAIRNDDGSNSNNVFGIKAGSSWKGSTTVVKTVEYTEGVAERVKAPFRSYGSMVESFNDYARLLLNNPRYENVVGSGEDSTAFAGALQNSGYATDPEYANKIKSIVNGETLKNAMHITRLTQQR
ncbi:MAG: flagellar assembly peptidoglycan hydrolase FlgJ [Gammaproteobacteria bacterium]